MENPSFFSDALGPYSLDQFKRPMRIEDEDEEDEYGENSCPMGCCDHDCECDDCLRCANNGIEEPDEDGGFNGEYSAA